MQVRAGVLRHRKDPPPYACSIGRAVENSELVKPAASEAWMRLHAADVRHSPRMTMPMWWKHYTVFHSKPVLGAVAQKALIKGLDPPWRRN